MSSKAAPDVVLIGAGIMSATLGMLLKKLQPETTIEIYERLDVIAGESSDAWNNAGTGHSAFCELNYTPERPDGSVEISKAIKIAESFEVSKEFWAYLIKQGFVKNPESFIRQVPHISFVWGADNVEYLKKRQQALRNNPLFADMQYSEDPAQLAQWMPLVMEGRDPSQKVAATLMEGGTDVNFGALTRSLCDYLRKQDGVTIYTAHEVKDIEKSEDGRWEITVRNATTNRKRTIHTPFV